VAAQLRAITATTIQRWPRDSERKPRPPSSGIIGIRLKRLIHAPTRAIAAQIGTPVSS